MFVRDISNTSFLIDRQIRFFFVLLKTVNSHLNNKPQMLISCKQSLRQNRKFLNWLKQKNNSNLI